MTDIKVEKAANKAHALDEAGQMLRESARKKWNKSLIAFIACFLILFALGVASYVRINQSVNKQNDIAQENKQHIDCIVKLFTTPLPTTARTRTISNASSTCNINFSQ